MFWFVLDAPYEIHFFINLSLYSDFYLNNCNAFRYYYIVKIIFFQTTYSQQIYQKIPNFFKHSSFQKNPPEARLKAVLVSMTFTCLKKN